MILSLALVHRFRVLMPVALNLMNWRQVILDIRLIKVKISMSHIAMERLSVQLVVLARPMISVNDRSLIIVPTGMESEAILVV